MIVNDIHAHPLHCSSAVNNKTPFHYVLACSLGFGRIWLPAHLFHNLLSLEGETCLTVFLSRLFKSWAELGQGKPWSRNFHPNKISSISSTSLNSFHTAITTNGEEEEKITRSPRLLWTSIFHNPLSEACRGKREYISYYHSIIFAFKGQKILGMSQDQHGPAPRERGGRREGRPWGGQAGVKEKGGEAGGGQQEHKWAGEESKAIFN